MSLGLIQAAHSTPAQRGASPTRGCGSAAPGTERHPPPLGQEGREQAITPSNASTVGLRRKRLLLFSVFLSSS